MLRFDADEYDAVEDKYTPCRANGQQPVPRYADILITSKQINDMVVLQSGETGSYGELSNGNPVIRKIILTYNSPTTPATSMMACDWVSEADMSH